MANNYGNRNNYNSSNYGNGYNNPNNRDNYNNGYNSGRTPPKKQGDWPWWVLFAIFMSGGLWPIGLIMLGIKLFGPDKRKSERRQAPPLYEQSSTYQHRTSESPYYNRQSAAPSRAKDTIKTMSETPSGSKKTTRLLMIIGCLLAFIGFIMLGDIDGFFSFLNSAAWMASGAAMIYSSFSLRNADKRYLRYMAIIGTNPAVEIKGLAKKVGVSERRCHKDVQKMIDKGYLGATAYINEELGYIFTSSDADDELRQIRDIALEKEQAAKEAQKQHEADENASFYENTVNRIRTLNDNIKHPEMSEKIYKLENITREIFRTVQNEPEKRNKIDKFLSYYLPTTLKLLESYAKLEKTGHDGENIAQSMKSIEAAMDSIVGGFEHQLDELYKADVLDIETDIDVMTKMLSRDSSESEFKVESTPKDSRTQFEKDFNVTRNSDGSISYGGSAAQRK